MQDLKRRYSQNVQNRDFRQLISENHYDAIGSAKFVHLTFLFLKVEQLRETRFKNYPKLNIRKKYFP